MSPSRPCSLRPLPRPRSAPAGVIGLAAAALAASALPAQAQTCQEIAGHIKERQQIVQSLQDLGKGKDKKMDPKAACAAFGKLASNGDTTLKWAEANKDWCQVPDQFVEGIKADHEKVLKLRGQACGVAAKLTEMEKKAKEGQGGGLLGGGGLEGTFKIPKGAL